MRGCSRMENPCKPDCPERTAECHGHCPRYAEYAAWCERQRQERHERQAVHAALNHGLRKKWYIDQWNKRHGKP